MPPPLAIWTTGSPVPSAEKARGPFARMIRERVGDYPGGFVDVHSITDANYPDPKNVSGIIVTGSPARLPDREPWMLRTMDALRHAFDAQVPILGICFGHQLLGEALGGRVAPNPRGREIGTVDVTHLVDDPLFFGIEAEPHIVMTHLDSVVEKPHDAEVLAKTDLDPHAALRYSDVVWSVQYHPEMDAEIVGYYLQDRRPDIEAEGLDVDAILARRRDTAYGAELLARFARFCATREF